MKKIISQIINILAMAVMGFFAVPKLLGQPESIKGFQQFEDALQINADFFRIFTGVAEISIVLLLLYFAITQKVKVGIFTYGFLLITMFTALGLEFLARPEPEMMLVIIAIVLIILSVYQIGYLKNKKILN